MKILCFVKISNAHVVVNQLDSNYLIKSGIIHKQEVMPTRREKIALTVFGVGGTAVISTPIPFLFSETNPQNIWMSIGLICADLALIQLLLIKYYAFLLSFTSLYHFGMISGLGAAIYQVLLLGDVDWVDRYTITILVIMIAIYSLFILLPAAGLLEGPQPEVLGYLKLCVISLGLCFVVFPTVCLIITIIQFPTSCYVNYGMSLAILIIAGILAGLWKREKLLTVAAAFYCIVYTPLAVFSIIKGFEEYRAKADLTATHHDLSFIFLLSFLGSNCVGGILVDVVIPIVVVGYLVWLGIKKLLGISSDAPPIAQSNNPPSVQNDLRKSLIDTNFEETKEDMCSICWEEFKEVDKLKKVKGCNHTFHSRCLEYWSQKNSTCPMCRVKIKTIFGVN